MLAYATIGSNDFKASAAFFDAVMSTLGYKRTHDLSEHGWLAYGKTPEDEVSVWLATPNNGEPATVGNGSMLGFKADTRAQVRAFHAAALANGGTDEGAPGIREQYGPNIYVGYVRDPLGNKFSAICRAPTE